MEFSERTEARGRSRAALYGLAAVAIVYLARQVLVPVALAILLTFVVTPLVVRIERLVRSRALAVVLTTILVIGVFGGGLLFAGHQFADLADDLPAYREKILHKVRAIQGGPGGLLGRATDSIRRIEEDIAHLPPAAPANGGPEHSPTISPPGAVERGKPSAPIAPSAQPRDTAPLGWSIVTSALEPLGSAAIVILLLVMMLMARENIRDRIIRLAGLHQIGFTTQNLEEAGGRIGKYLRAQLLINTIFAVAVGTGLLILGLPNAALCGIFAGVLRFVPILGPWLGAAIPAALALAVSDGWQPFFIVFALFAALEVLTNFVVEPRLYGSRTGLSSFGIILAIVFWTWVWGGVGLVLAVPMTVCVVVFTRHIPHLSALSILLGDEPVLSDSMRYYQRLLCRDEEEAAAILAASPADADPATVLDEVVVASLCAARADLRRGLITEGQAARIATTARDLALEWLTDRDTGRAALTPTEPSGLVVCLPAHDGLDEAAGAVLVGLLGRDNIRGSAISAALLFSEKIAATDAPGVNLIVVSSVAPAGDLHTRRICKSLQRKLSEIPVIVVAWVGDAADAAVQTEGEPVAGHSRVSTNRQAIALVKSLLAVRPARDSSAVPAPPRV